MESSAPSQLEEDVRDFLIESNENLCQLDRELVELEQRPGDADLISSVFRTIHTIKGTCGFFGFDTLGSITHVTENLLCQVREGERELTPELISLVLEAVDKVKVILGDIESLGKEGPDRCAALRERLAEAHERSGAPAQASAASPDSLADFCADFFQQTLAQQTAKAVETTHAEVAAPEPAAEAQAAGDAGGRSAQVEESTIRVGVGLLNKLMNLVGELVLARNQLLQESAALNPALQKTSQRLNLITSELQEGVMKTRMQPIGVVWNKLPRVVRDLAAKCGKKVHMEMAGAETELDKTIIEAIKDPLTHIVRNSCDHGIELPEVRAGKGKTAEGHLLLRAFHEGGVVNIEISDDGAGIEPEKLKRKALEKGLIRPEQAAGMTDREARHLIFMPGFSTAEQVTSISGRGVGMDVVKTNIEKIGGTVEILDRVPCGTTIRIKIPLTLAIIPGLVVTLHPDPAGRKQAREQRFVVPQASLVELVRLEGARDLALIKNLHGTPIFHHRGKLLPLVHLAGLLGRSAPVNATEVVNIVVVHAENCQMGLVVDGIHDTQEIVVKPLGRQLKALPSYLGATIMGDGRPALILDAAGLARLAGLNGHGLSPAMVMEQEAERTLSAAEKEMLLLFRSGRFERLAVPLASVARLEEVPASRVEWAGGRKVLQYRGDILPLVALSDVLEPARKQPVFTQETVHVIVFADGERRMGLVVDGIIDIVKDEVKLVRNHPVRGLSGSAVIGGAITDLLDLQAVVSETGASWSGGASWSDSAAAAGTLPFHARSVRGPAFAAQEAA